MAIVATDSLKPSPFDMNVNTLRSLTAMQWWWVFKAYFKLWPIHIRLRYGSAAWLFDKIQLQGIAGQGNEIVDDKLRDIATHLHESVRLAGRCHIFRTDCLPRSLVFCEMLNGILKRSQHDPRSPMEAVVRIGVLRSAGKPEASKPGLASHAWVEIQGSVIGEPEQVAERFQTLAARN